MPRPVIRRTESHIDAVEGRSLFRRAWLPDRPERVLLLAHGVAEHSGRYEHLGAWFAARGCAVHAYDQRGHGRSSGVRGYVRRLSELVDDLEIVLDAVRGEHRGLPLFPLGYDLGGLLVCELVRERQPGVAGAIAAAAPLAPRADASRRRAFAVRALRRAVPRLRLDAAVAPADLSRDPEVEQAYRADPLVLHELTASLAAELAAAARRGSRGAGDVRVPMLLLHGEGDPICPVAGSRAFHAALTAEGCRLRTYPELRHALFHEPERAAVFEDVLDWLRSAKFREVT